MPPGNPIETGERVVDPKTGVVMSPEEFKEMEENTDRNNP